MSYVDEDGETMTVPVTGGRCKLQWKADWAMRWHALGVDYEMAGKDLISSVELSGKICRALGSRPPVGFIYELFLDENGERSRSHAATGSPSRSGSPMGRAIRSRSTCTTRRGGPSGSTSM